VRRDPDQRDRDLLGAERLGELAKLAGNVAVGIDVVATSSARTIVKSGRFGAMPQVLPGRRRLEQR
jgi:hypothetical protein